MAERYAYKIELDTYCCDGNQIVKPSGALQVLQEAGRRQMEAQKPSYEEILEAGKALMLSRIDMKIYDAVSYTHLRAHETGRNLVCRLLLEKKKKKR